MAEVKKSFVLYSDLIKVIEHLPDEVAGKLFKIILKYVNDEVVEIEDLLLKIAFEPIKLQLKRDLDKFETVKSERSETGGLGNLKRWNLDLYKDVVANKITLKKAIEIAKSRKLSLSDKSNRKRSQTVANVAVTVNDTVNDTVSVINKEKEEKKIKRFSAPTILELEDYFFLKTEKKEFSKSCAKKFFNYYESNGWMVGRTKMKNWKAAVSNWISRQKDFEPKSENGKHSQIIIEKIKQYD